MRWTQITGWRNAGLLLLFACLSIWQPSGFAEPATPLTPFTAEYRLYVNKLPIGRQHMELQHRADNTYLYSSETRSEGIAAFLRKDVLNEASHFSLHQDRIRPLDYRFLHRNEEKKHEVRIDFDWQHLIATNRIEKDAWRMPIPADALDKLVVQLALMRDIARGRQEVEYAIADGGKLKHFRFKVLGQAVVHIPAGRYETVKLERIRADQDRTTYIWLAPALDYLPVQIKQIENEDGLVYLSKLTDARLIGGKK